MRYIPILLPASYAGTKINHNPHACIHTRCGSSQVLALVLHWTAVVNSLGGSMRAHKMRNPLTVDSVFAMGMLAVNASIVVAVATILVIAAAVRRIHWPAPSIALPEARSLPEAKHETSYAPVHHHPALPLASHQLTDTVHEVCW